MTLTEWKAQPADDVIQLGEPSWKFSLKKISAGGPGSGCHGPNCGRHREMWSLHDELKQHPARDTVHPPIAHQRDYTEKLERLYSRLAVAAKGREEEKPNNSLHGNVGDSLAYARRKLDDVQQEYDHSIADHALAAMHSVLSQLTNPYTPVWKRKMSAGGPGSGCHGPNCGRPSLSPIEAITTMPSSFSGGMKGFYRDGTYYCAPALKFVHEDVAEWLPDVQMDARDKFKTPIALQKGYVRLEQLGTSLYLDTAPRPGAKQDLLRILDDYKFHDLAYIGIDIATDPVYIPHQTTVAGAKAQVNMLLDDDGHGRRRMAARGDISLELIRRKIRRGVEAYSEDQPRDERGRWTKDGEGGRLTDKQKAFYATLRKRMDDAIKAKAEIDAKAAQINSTTRVIKVPVKAWDRAAEKVEKDYGGDVNRITDLARNTIVAPSGAEKKVLEKVLQLYPGAQVKEHKAEEDPLGFSGILAKVPTKYGPAEIQINNPKMIYAKEPPEIAKRFLTKEEFMKYSNHPALPPGGQGHKFYESWRKLPRDSAQAKAIEHRAKRYYKAFRDTLI